MVLTLTMYKQGRAAMKKHHYHDSLGDHNSVLTPEEVRENVNISEDGDRIFMARVYNWMAGGLAISGLTAWKISSMMVDQTSFFYRSPGVFLILFLFEICFKREVKIRYFITKTYGTITNSFF